MADAAPRLPARSSRGNRMTSVMLEEEKGEDEFWSQHKDMFADEADDNEFSDAAEEEDVVDADFDAPEDQPAPETEAQEAEKEVKKAEKPDKKKKKGYVDPKRHPQHAKRQRKEKVHIGEEPREPVPRKVAPTPGATDESVATHLRASTKKMTKQRNAERQRQEEEYEIRRATRPRRSGGGEGPRMSQEQLLAEAVRTEESNRASLEVLLRIEEERKRVGPVVPAISGPMVRYKSTAASTTVSFLDLDLPSPPFSLSLPTPPAPRVCAVTGLPARYIDPKTSQPYASVAAFRTLREKAAAVKVQALSALLEEKRRKREEAKGASTPVPTVLPATPVSAPASVPTPTAQTAASGVATPTFPAMSEEVITK